MQIIKRNGQVAEFDPDKIYQFTTMIPKIRPSISNLFPWHFFQVYD